MVLSEMSWRDYAACKGMDKIFFPEQDRNSTREAQAICATCPVKRPCYRAGIYELHGVWAGTTPDQRVEIRKLLRRMEKIGVPT